MDVAKHLIFVCIKIWFCLVFKIIQRRKKLFFCCDLQYFFTARLDWLLKRTEMSLNFQDIIDKAFNYEEALIRQGLKQEDVEKLRDKVRDSKFVPKSIVDKQVMTRRRF